MQLAINVDRVAAIRKGINATSYEAFVEVNPADLSPEDRQLIADHIYEIRHGKHAGHEASYERPILRVVKHKKSTEMITTTGATTADLLEAIKIADAEQKAEADKKAQYEKKAEANRRQQTLAAFEARNTKKIDKPIWAHRAADGSIEFIEHYYHATEKTDGKAIMSYLAASLPYDVPDINEREDVKDWLADIELARVDALTTAQRAAVANLEAKEAAARQAELGKIKAQAEAKEWVAANGSTRLKRCVAEGFEFMATYRDERLAADRPGWLWEEQVRGEGSEPRNPSEEAFEILDRARATDPSAKLQYWFAKPDMDEDCNELDEFRGYVAVAEFMGKQIVYGGPAY